MFFAAAIAAHFLPFLPLNGLFVCFFAVPMFFIHAAPCCLLLPFIFADTSLHAARNHYSTGDAKSIRIARHLTHTVLPNVSL